MVMHWGPHLYDDEGQCTMCMMFRHEVERTGAAECILNEPTPEQRIKELEERLAGLAKVWAELKSLTKQHPAALWTPEYRELAEKIHAAGRDFLFVKRLDTGFGPC